jgi:hypothetical protein
MLLILSCQEKVSPLQFEQKVFDEVFLKIVNSTYKDKRLYTFFPDKNKSFNDPVYLKERRMLENDTIGLVIAIDNKRVINFGKMKSRKFIFKSLYEVKGEDIEYEKWSKKYPKFAGEMSFSKIVFDQKHLNGKLTVSYYCGQKCGLGYDVYIRKVNQIWKIIKVKRTWIS